MSIAKPLNDVFLEFNTFCDDLLQKIVKYSKFTSYGSTLMIERLYEMLFMKLETLIETAFVSYAMGHLPANGNPFTRNVALNNEEDILGLICGLKDYPDWTNWSAVTKTSDIFFSPSPFAYISNYLTQLNDIKTIRNALSHISGTSQKKFESLVRKKLGYYPSTGLPVSAFLLYHVPSTRSQIFFQEYIENSRSVARLICYI